MGLRWNNWNLLLLIPLVWIVTPLFNREGPPLFGMPFFYWFQFLGIVVGVLSTTVVFVMTREKKNPSAPGAGPDVDELDEGARR